MSTTYGARPSILDRVVGSHLVAMATIRGPIRVVPIEQAERPRAYGWFEATIRDALSGEPPAETVVVRVIGEGDEDRITWPVPIPSDEPLPHAPRRAGPS
jgi:hypothetical protein